MTDTITEAPQATNDATPALNAALAKVQAELPKIAKGETATVPGKEGKRGYEYSYAGLDAVSAAILPLIGKHGLAFMARPTRENGEFGLAYSLRHASGEQIDGFFPMDFRGSPQQIGGLITYARRYCLCSVTGVAPGGDDDDAAAATHDSVQMGQRSARDPWEDAAPARPNQRGAGGRPARGEPASRQTATEPDPDAQVFADEAHQARTVAELADVQRRAREAGKLAAIIRNPSSGGTGGFGAYAGWRKKQLEDEDAALRELQSAAGDMAVADLEAHVMAVTGTGIEGATAAQLRQAAGALKSGVPAEQGALV